MNNKYFYIWQEATFNVFKMFANNFSLYFLEIPKMFVILSQNSYNKCNLV